MDQRRDGLQVVRLGVEQFMQVEVGRQLDGIESWGRDPPQDPVAIHLDVGKRAQTWRDDDRPRPQRRTKSCRHIPRPPCRRSESVGRSRLRTYYEPVDGATRSARRSRRRGSYVSQASTLLSRPLRSESPKAQAGDQVRPPRVAPPQEGALSPADVQAALTVLVAVAADPNLTRIDLCVSLPAGA